MFKNYLQIFYDITEFLKVAKHLSILLKAFYI